MVARPAEGHQPVMVDMVLKYEGRVDRFLGDGLLALFGLHQVHEDDPERAVRAAVEIREAARHLGLEVTAGINTGTVYVGPIGSEIAGTVRLPRAGHDVGRAVDPRIVDG